MASRQCMLAMELQDIEREKFDGLLAKRQYFPIKKLHYVVSNRQIVCLFTAAC